MIWLISACTVAVAAISKHQVQFSYTAGLDHLTFTSLRWFLDFPTFLLKNDIYNNLIVSALDEQVDVINYTMYSKFLS
jgi:hypothetical protein